ncbi:MAG: polyprenyl synthetase family protein [Anaerolineales bacterium]|jgi:geranylgeranyl pyrophosphate synthase
MESLFEREKARLLSHPSVTRWADLEGCLRTVLASPRHDWELPSLACKAVGGDPQAVGPAAAALICEQLSITLVDDVLDEDPRGLHNTIGSGRVANISLALVGLAFELVKDLQVEPWRKLAIIMSLASMELETAYGQHLDVTEPRTEESYWKILQRKSTPYYAVALSVGALAGGASLEISQKVSEIGGLIGEITQIYDDLTDALQTPANPDWNRPGANLAILYAISAPHPDQEAFKGDLATIADDKTLRHAQGLLIRSGAVSYCAYHVAQRVRAARALVHRTGFADPDPLLTLLSSQAAPLSRLLSELGVSRPLDLLTEEHEV